MVNKFDAFLRDHPDASIAVGKDVWKMLVDMLKLPIGVDETTYAGKRIHLIPYLSDDAIVAYDFGKVCPDSTFPMKFEMPVHKPMYFQDRLPLFLGMN